jgi:glycosyltransferase involved in cell wall biosynthesis
VHQLIGYSHEIYDLIKNLGASYDITLHDYYYICPRVNLIDAFENYCGEPDENGCRQCVDQLNTHVFCQNVYRQLGSDISAWRDHHSQFFQNARRIFAPSYDIERRMRKYFNFSNVLVRPHPELPAAIHPRRPAPSSILSVAIIGAIGLLKGFRVIIGCAEDAQQRNLPIRYVVIGYTCDDNALKNFTNVIITGKYERSELGNLLIKYNCGIAAFFSVCPETYSYTLSEAWSFGLFPISFDIGAIAERIKLNGFGLTIPFPSTPQVINDHLIKIGKELETYVPQNSFGQDYSNIIQDYYDFDKDKTFC